MRLNLSELEPVSLPVATLDGRPLAGLPSRTEPVCVAFICRRFHRLLPHTSPGYRVLSRARGSGRWPGRVLRTEVRSDLASRGCCITGVQTAFARMVDEMTGGASAFARMVDEMTGGASAFARVVDEMTGGADGFRSIGRWFCPLLGLQPPC